MALNVTVGIKSIRVLVGDKQRFGQMAAGRADLCTSEASESNICLISLPICKCGLTSRDYSFFITKDQGQL